MEITKVFKACVKTAKARKNAGDILPKSKRKERSDENSFNNKAIEVVNSITKLKQFLLNYQCDYLNEFSHVSSASSMNEEERDQIDEDAQVFIKSCSIAIDTLKSEVNKKKVVDSNKTLHSNAVVELLEMYLIDVSKLYSQLRAFRVKQAVDRKKMSKLKPDHRSTKKEHKKIDEKLEEESNSSVNAESDSKIKEHSGKPIQKIPMNEITKSQNIVALEESKQREAIQFTAEETQLFAEENDVLYKQMNSLVKEIQNIEGKVIEIGQLQEIFQEKVLSQSEQIESIHGTAVSTTENVKEGNEEIREAIKNTATFRVWVLFFLVMCTFSLLFLDWYNP